MYGLLWPSCYTHLISWFSYSGEVQNPRFYPPMKYRIYGQTHVFILNLMSVHIAFLAHVRAALRA